MTPLSNYTNLVDGIFGTGSASLSQAGTYTNNVVGALNDATDYKTFSDCFVARLKRLNEIYHVHDPHRKNIIDQVNLIATDNWEGAYSELAAFDFLNQECDAKTKPIELNVNVIPNRTYALECGGKGPANLDGWYADWDVFFDVKSLKDNAKEILTGICSDVYARLGKGTFLIRPTYPLHMPIEILQERRNDVLAELLQRIDLTTKPRLLHSGIVDELDYRIEWKPGISITESGYNPFEHAEQHYTLAFRHVKKYVKDRPFFLVFVCFPWFNGIVTDFSSFNESFYRSFARRVFCQYIRNPMTLSSLNKDFKGTETTYGVSRKLAGILFLEDRCIDGRHPDSRNVCGRFYFNPNADNKLTYTLFYDCTLQQRLCWRDDFAHDNY